MTLPLGILQNKSTPGGNGAEGLSSAHIPPKTRKIEYSSANLQVWEGASLLKVSHEKYKIPQIGGGVRNQITQFSRQSRRRLMQILAQLDRSEKPVFCTLTYPKEFTTDSRVWKNDLEKFYKRLSRAYPDSCFIWKLEPQKRGAPHYHLLVWGVSYFQLLRFVSTAWYRSVGSGDKKHFMAGSNIQEIKSWRGVMSYASKYMGKVFDSPMMQDLGWSQPGRFWGIKGRKNLPQVFATVIDCLTDDQVYQFMRLMRRYANIKARSTNRSMSIFCDDPTQWIRVIDAL